MPVLGLENWEGVTIGGSDLFFLPGRGRSILAESAET